MRGILPAAAALLLLSGPAAGAPHRYRLHPNAAITILGIAEGPDGLLWLAAEDGLYRFDGFHYHRIPDYPFGTARFVAFTSDGALWCGGLEGLARRSGGQWTVLLRDPVLGMAAAGDKLFVNRRQILVADTAGALRPLPVTARRDLNVDGRGWLWFVSADTRRVSRLNAARPEERREETPAGQYEEAVADGQGRLWASAGERAERIENGRPVEFLERQRAGPGRRLGPLTPGRGGQVWFTGEVVRGLNPPLEFAGLADAQRFAPSAGFEDRRGRFWVALEGYGLVEWIPEPGWERWTPEDFGGGAALQVTGDGQGGVWLATSRRVLAFRDGWRPLTAETGRFDAVLPLGGGGFLAALQGAGIVRMDATGRRVEQFGDPREGFREMVRDRAERVWLASKRGLWRLEGRPGSLRLARQELPGVAPGASASPVDLELDEAGRLWVGYAAGVAHLDGDRWRPLETEAPVTLVRTLSPGPGDIWIAFRAPGAFARLRLVQGEWRTRRFAALEGFPPVDTHFVKRDSRGWVWRGSPEGVHVSDGRNVEPEGWLEIRSGNGLTALETSPYGFYEDAAGEIWVAGDKGVTRMRPDPAWFTGPPGRAAPVITRVDADGRQYAPEELPGALRGGVRLLRIEFGGLEAREFQGQPLRYRLTPAAPDWRETRDGVAVFQNLADGEHVFECGYAGAAAVARYAFRTGAPPGFPAVWVVLAVAAAAAAVRFLPWFESWNYRLDKAIFLLRRRFRRIRAAADRGYSEDDDLTGMHTGGAYELVRLISRGGFATVYEARDRRHPGERFAVKVLSRASGESWVRDRFAHEVLALRSVSHPGVVPVLDSWVNGRGQPCLAMPYLEGPTLRDELRSGRIPAERAAVILRQLGEAVAAVHDRGIVHRDLKPENLLLTGDRVMILDFGTAGLRGAENELAATTLMAGSFHYLAPERLTGHYSPASDLYSMGVIALEMLSGKRLSDLRCTFSEQEFAADLADALDGRRAVAEVLRGAFDPDPRRRPSDAAAWTAELASLLIPG